MDLCLSLLQEIEFSHFFMRYAPKLPDVLFDLTFRIPAKSKVGICGRTGSGKSSLAAALFRLVEGRSGSIKIDGRRTDSVGLHTLRSMIGMVPQVCCHAGVLFKLCSIVRNERIIWSRNQRCSWEL